MRLSDGFQLLATAPDGVAHLRDLILSLAVRGSLSSRDVLDEPLSRLGQRISSEREHLIEAGRIKGGGIPSPVIKEEEPFDLPLGWQWTRLGSLALQITDGTHHTPKYLPAGVPFISIKDIDGRTVSFDDCKFISEDEHALINRRCNPERGDVLICRIGTLGRPTIVDTDVPFSVFVSVGLIKLPKSIDISAYLHMTLRSPPLADQYEQIKAGGSHTQKLNLGDIPQLLIPLPPIEEQARIVAKVDELMQLCDELEIRGRLEAEQHARLTATLFDALAASESAHALAENWARVAAHFDLLLDRPEAVDALEQTILQLAVRGLLVPQDPNDEPASKLLKQIRVEKDRLVADGKIRRDKPLPTITTDDEPFALPVCWEWVRFDELNTPNKPISYGVLVPGPDVKSGVPFVRLGDLSIASPSAKPEKTISPEVDAQYLRTRLDGGEILMGVVGSIGKLGIAPESWKGANIARAICRIVPSSFVDKMFILLLLQSEFMQLGFSGDTRTVAQPTLNVGLIRSALTPLPPFAEQRRIAVRVDELRRLCADLRARLTSRRTCQARFAEALVDQNASALPLENTDDLAAAA